MEGLNIYTIGGFVIIITTLLLILKSKFTKKDKKTTEEIQKQDEDLKNKIQRIGELLDNAKKEIEETGKIKDIDKLVEEFDKW